MGYIIFQYALTGNSFADLEIQLQTKRFQNEKNGKMETLFLYGR